ncbi:hypothetical protein Cantr_04492 [Candida viswanathii]|uniref:Uncharacterized protein n=1 Tax=Candida viswanathii TaxID=5486 RepID=A0A367XLI5_9ASCO|nr:hypothetical protein Cantr_04492 [Candida viswanathii]
MPPHTIATKDMTAKDESKTESKHEGFRSKVDEIDDKLLKFPKSVHHGLHKGADKTSHKVADGTKKVFHHDK